MKRTPVLFPVILLCSLLITAFVALYSYRLLTRHPYIAPTAEIGSGGGVPASIPLPTVDYLSPVESEIISEINLARTQPKAYAAFLEETKKYYSSNQLRYPSRPVELTVEGLSALEEAISFLRAQNPLSPLKVHKGMSLAAKDQARDLGTSGNTGHRGSDGSTPTMRVSRYGDWLNSIGENIVYQTSTTARESVMGLIVDDGIAGRGHRKNIFDSTYNVAGIALGERSDQGTLCVITFAGGFTEKVAAGGEAAAPTGKPVARKY